MSLRFSRASNPARGWACCGRKDVARASACRVEIRLDLFGHIHVSRRGREMRPPAVQTGKTFRGWRQLAVLLRSTALLNQRKFSVRFDSVCPALQYHFEYGTRGHSSPSSPDSANLGCARAIPECLAAGCIASRGCPRIRWERRMQDLPLGHLAQLLQECALSEHRFREGNSGAHGLRRLPWPRSGPRCGARRQDQHSACVLVDGAETGAGRLPGLPRS